MAEKDKSHIASMIEKDEKLKLLAFAAAVVIVISLIVALATPGGTGIERCNSVVLSVNREQCVYQLALSSENSTLCGNLSQGDMNSCYLSVAEATKNSGPCYKIGYASGIASCVNAVANSTDSYRECYGLSGTYRDSCIGLIALKDRNASLCTQISDALNDTICSSSINFAEALQRRNASYCSKVTATSDQNITASVLDESGMGNYSLAYSNVSDYSFYLAFLGNVQFNSRDFCYLSFATQFRNKTSCAGISNSTLQQSCLAAMIYTPSTSNSAIFNALNYTPISNICSNSSLGRGSSKNCSSFVLLLKAVSTRNTTLCSTLPLNFSYECYATLASQYYNASYCRYIKNVTLSNACETDIYYNATAAQNGTGQGYP